MRIDLSRMRCKPSRTVMRDIKRGIFILRDTYVAPIQIRGKLCTTRVGSACYPRASHVVIYRCCCVYSLVDGRSVGKDRGNLYCNTVIESTLTIRFRGDWKMWQCGNLSLFFDSQHWNQHWLFGVFIIKEKER